MSAFSDTLSQYISNKNVKVYSMAKYCDTDRSSMYNLSVESVILRLMKS